MFSEIKEKMSEDLKLVLGRTIDDIIIEEVEELFHVLTIQRIYERFNNPYRRSVYTDEKYVRLKDIPRIAKYFIRRIREAERILGERNGT